MAHMIEIVDGKAKMVYAGEVPWHGLGKKIPSDLSPEQVIKTADLDWTVRKVPAFVTINEKEYPIDRSALVRDTDDKILDIVSDDWNILQNHEAFEFFHDFVAAGAMQMHTAGSLRGGQIVWALAKINDGFELFNGDAVESYLLFTNPHRYGWSIDVRFTPIRVVCNNTLTLSLNTKANSMVKVSHRSTFDTDQVKETLGIAKNKLSKYKEMASFLGSKRYNDVTVTEYFQQVFPTVSADVEKRKALSKAATRALTVLDNQPGVEYAPGTWWQAFNAVTFMADHIQGRSRDNRLMSSWYGQGKLLKTKALETAVQFAEAA